MQPSAETRQDLQTALGGRGAWAGALQMPGPPLAPGAATPAPTHAAVSGHKVLVVNGGVAELQTGGVPEHGWGYWPGPLVAQRAVHGLRSQLRDFFFGALCWHSLQR